MTTTIPFTKMVAAGNDFLVVDTKRHPLRALAGRWGRIAPVLCDRHAGIGADGLLVLEPSGLGDARMRVFNPDGSEAAMCGNGARCAALYLKTPWRSGLGALGSGQERQQALSPCLPARHRFRGGGGGRRDAQTRRKRGRQAEPRALSQQAVLKGALITIETRAGVVSAQVWGNRVAMSMMAPADLRPDLAIAVAGRTIRGTYINTGVPHLVVPVTALDRVDVNRLGRALRAHRAFAPHGTNVDFIERDGRQSRLRIRTYERGVEAETMACGTGVTAAAVVHGLQRAASSRQRTHGTVGRHRVTVATRSGERLGVSFAVVVTGRGVRATDVRLEGTARRICDGTVPWPLERR